MVVAFVYGWNKHYDVYAVDVRSALLKITGLFVGRTFLFVISPSVGYYKTNALIYAGSQEKHRVAVFPF